MTDRYIIGQTIAALRKEAGLTQTELADKLHVSHQAVSQWERAETLPDILTLPALAEIFGQSVGTLLGMAEKDPVGKSVEPGNPTSAELKPAENLPSRAWRISTLSEDCDYTVVLEKNGVKIQEIPADLQKQVIIVLEGNCRNLSSAFTTEIRGNVEGDIDVREESNVTVTIQGDVHGDVDCGELTVGGSLEVHGDINGDVDCVACHVEGDINGDVDAACSVMVEGNVDGDITASDSVTVDGSVDGDIAAYDSVTVNGNAAGTISSESVIIHGTTTEDDDSDEEEG